VDINGWRWQPTPAVDDAEHAVRAIAAGAWKHDQIVTWLLHLQAPDRQQP
jgi:hypothetical protein